MGKPKKGKKSAQGDEFGSDIEEDIKAIKNEKKGVDKFNDSSKNEFTDISESNQKSKKKKGKVKDDDSDIDQIAKEIESIDLSKKKNKMKKTIKQISDNEDSDDESERSNKKTKPKKAAQKKHVLDDDGSDIEEVDSKKSKSKKPDKVSKKNISKDSDNDSDDVPVVKSQQKAKKVKGGFALLEVDSEPENISDVPPESDDEIQMKNKKGLQKDIIDSKKEAGGKKSKKKKKRDDSDEDIEKVLAELELEYSGGKKEEESKAPEDDEQVNKKKIKTRKNVVSESPLEENEDLIPDDNDLESGGTVKTAAQKKKEKKEREKAKKLTAKKQDVVKKQASTESEPSEAKEIKLSKDTATNKEPEDFSKDDNGAIEAKDGKKKKKGAKEEKETKTKKGPGSKTIAAMQEALKKMKEEEERLKREEEERIKREEEAEIFRLEQLRLEQERKDKKKKKEKERKERLKAEGKLLTSKQKADRARAQAMIEALKAQGVDVPEVGEKKPRPGTRVRPNKLKKESSQEKSTEEPPKSDEVPEEKVEVEIVDKPEEKVEEDDVKDAWDADSSEEEPSEETKETSPQHKKQTKPDLKNQQSIEESESESESEEESSDESSKESEDDSKMHTDAERKRAKALARIQNRREEAEKNRSVEELRAAVVCVLGHVDTGKTKILDKLRRTNVQDGEAGGITQQIGATNVPIDNIKDQTKYVKGFSEKPLKLPGLLIIDTPGHESFSNLRSRGSSLCDIAILVVDIMHGLEPQTIESINLLKTRRTPFVVALNKIDRLYDWQTMNRKDVRDILKAQATHTQLEFEKKTKEVTLQFAEQSLNAALFYDNPDPRTYISLVPTSAITGEGIGNILALIVEFCQTHIAKRLMYSSELLATVLEVKALTGLGTTIDAILINGILREGDTIILAGTDGPIVTQIKALLMPEPMRELRVKNAYKEFKEIKAAQGVKIAAKELEKAIAGLNLVVAQYPDEVEILKEEVAHELKSALSSIKLQERGVFVQASTLGSLEALLDFLKSSKIPYAGIRIGPVVKKDVIRASIMLEHDSQYACILAFDVKVESEAQLHADSLGVKIFQADIIYHLFDAFTAYREDLKRRKREEFRKIAVFPCKIRVLPQFVFNSRDPIVVGVMIEAGIVREGTPICVPSKEFVDLGIVTSIESNHKQVESARKGMEVCVKIEPIPGESPKMFGRHFDETDMLVSKISRQSIDACKNYFRDDLLKSDWQLMVELKNMFQIL